MFEKVNSFHPDKVADRIAGAIVDLAYTQAEGGWAKSNPKVAVEVLIGHGEGLVIIETSEQLHVRDVTDIVERISGIKHCTVRIVPQDPHLAKNQENGAHVGDNGVFKGMPVTEEQRLLSAIARTLAANFPSDGKYIIASRPDDERDMFGAPIVDVTICQSHLPVSREQEVIDHLLDSLYRDFIKRDTQPYERLHFKTNINPLGEWTGGPDADSGATNRKLGSDMGDAVTGGGLMGKDLSKADVSVNIMCHIFAQKYGRPVEAHCAIGDEEVRFCVCGNTAECSFEGVTMPFSEIMEEARLYIMTQHGSFEHFSAWGLI